MSLLSWRRPLLLLTLLLTNHHAATTTAAAATPFDMSTAAAYQTILSSELDAMPLSEIDIAYAQDTAIYVQLALLGGATAYVPYVICSTLEGTSGEQRRAHIATELDVQLNYTSMVLYNQADKSCFVVSLVPENLEKTTSTSSNSTDDISYQPLSPFMKMRGGLLRHTNNADPSDVRLQRIEVTLCPHEDVNEISAELQELYDHLSSSTTVDGSTSTSTPEDYIQEALQLFPFANSDLIAGLINEGLLTPQSELNQWYQATVDCFGNAVAGGIFDFVELETSQVRNSATITFPANAVPPSCALSIAMAVTTHTSVCSVERSVPMEAANIQAQWITQSGVNNVRPWFDMGLDGTNEIITVSDSGLDTDNCYFWDSSPGELKEGSLQLGRRKVVQYFPYQDDSDIFSGHGTHVAGTAAGKRSTDGTTATSTPGMADGAAPGAKISFFDVALGYSCCYLPDAEAFMNIGYMAGSRIHNGSWGSIDPSYTSKASGIDYYLWYTDDMLLVMAVGNYGVYDGTTTEPSILSPSNAKNVLSVGATGSHGRDLVDGALGYEYLAPFSSRGPTVDGRIKPDVVAPGYAILSAGARPGVLGECDPTTDVLPETQLPYSDEAGIGLTYKAGTSMAAPVVSGTAAILRQYFAEGYYPTGAKNATNVNTNPSSALLKAILINGAQDLKGIDYYGEALPTAPYDHNQGHGRVNMLTSMPLQGVNDISAVVHDRVRIDNDEVHSYTLQVTEQCCADDVSVTLVWTDHPGSPGCTQCLVNDLDLLVTNDNTGAVSYPNGGMERDAKNNVERIRIPADVGDSFTVTVSGANLIFNQQKYSLLATGCFGGRAGTGVNTCASASNVLTEGCPPVDVCRCDADRQCVAPEVKLARGADLNLCLVTTGILTPTTGGEDEVSTQSFDPMQLLSIDSLEMAQSASSILVRPIKQGGIPADEMTTASISSGGNNALISTQALSSAFYADTSTVTVTGAVVMGYSNAASASARSNLFSDYQCSSTFELDIELDDVDEDTASPAVSLDYMLEQRQMVSVVVGLLLVMALV